MNPLVPRLSIPAAFGWRCPHCRRWAMWLPALDPMPVVALLPHPQGVQHCPIAGLVH